MNIKSTNTKLKKLQRFTEMDRSQYLHPDKELMSRQEIEELQLKRLKETVRHCMNSPFYKKRFEEEGLTPDDIKSLDDLKKIPFTTKNPMV